MKNINQIKTELYAFGKKHGACEKGLNSIKENSLTELFNNSSYYIGWCKENYIKAKEFNSIFNNELVIENGVLLCDCTGLKSVTIPNSVTSIGDFAFYKCTELVSIVIPNSVISIKDGVFYNCIELKSITIPESITSIDYDIFRNCNFNLEIIRK